jgi:hypothetical protein
MKKRLYKSNLNTQFGVEEIPSDNQIRSILGSINPEQFSDVFKTYLYRLQRGNHLKKLAHYGFRGLANRTDLIENSDPH